MDCNNNVNCDIENKEIFEKLVLQKAKKGFRIIDVKDEYREEIEELIIPESWQIIAIINKSPYGPGPFKNCKKLRTVILPSTLKSIQNRAFNYCESLEVLHLPDSLETLGDSNFAHCGSLAEVTLPDNLKSIGCDNFEGSAFYNDPRNWTHDGCLYIGKYFLKYNAYTPTSIEVRDGTEIIANGACKYSRFSTVTFPETLRHIGDEAFYNCTNLSNITLPDGIEYIGKGAFKIRTGYYDYELDIGILVSEGTFKDGKIVLEYEFGFIPPAQLRAIADKLDEYLLKIEYEVEHSYDNSDDDRCEDSYSRYDSYTYREMDIRHNSKALLRIDGEIRGLVFRVKGDREDDPHIFLFDGSRNFSMTLGYSASHSSDYMFIKKMALVKKGENGAPESAVKVRFNPYKLSASI